MKTQRPWEKKPVCLSPGDPAGLLTSHTVLIGELMRDPVGKTRWTALGE